jgi:hypothetical protein
MHAIKAKGKAIPLNVLNALLKENSTFMRFLTITRAPLHGDPSPSGAHGRDMTLG